MVDRLLALAQLLVDEGYVDNEPDARLAAVHILAALRDPPVRDGDTAEPEPEQSQSVRCPLPQIPVFRGVE